MPQSGDAGISCRWRRGIFLQIDEPVAQYRIPGQAAPPGSGCPRQDPPWAGAFPAAAGTGDDILAIEEQADRIVVRLRMAGR